MALLRTVLGIAILFQLFVHKTSAQTLKCSNLWAVEVKGGSQAAKRLAAKHNISYISKIFADFHVYRQNGAPKITSCVSSNLNKALRQDKNVIWHEQQVLRSYKLHAPVSQITFNDPLWTKQWYINGDHKPSHNVKAVWDQQITGEGIIVAVVDDGLDKNHTDLTKNFDASVSFDVQDNDRDPSPLAGEYHGSKCAGVIAAAADNSVCGVGIAFNSKIGGIRLTSGDTTDAQEAQALSYERDRIDIYSNSWGPGEFAQIEGPGHVTSKALEDGAKHGRKGRGSIFVFAAGNGGAVNDSCAFNGFVNNIYTNAISGANKDGSLPAYAERCPGIIAVAYSGELGNSDDVVTVNEKSECTNTFSRTSAAAAMASGLIALLLQSQKNLGWRDVQHVIIRSARPDINALKSGKWKKNGAGFFVSNYYGFGLMDASKMVEYGKSWKSVPDQIRCEIPQGGGPWAITATTPLELSIALNDWSTYCSGKEIKYLEHVQVRVNLIFSRRGNLLVDLQSPNKTVSQLIQRRPADTIFVRSNNLTDWTVTTLHHWGEGAVGTWTITLKNYDPTTDHKGTLFSWALILYGTNTDPLKGNPHVPPSPISPTRTEGTPAPNDKINPTKENQKEGLGTGAITGIVVGILLVLMIVSFTAYFLIRKFKGWR